MVCIVSFSVCFFYSCLKSTLNYYCVTIFIYSITIKNDYHYIMTILKEKKHSTLLSVHYLYILILKRQKGQIYLSNRAFNPRHQTRYGL